MLSCGHVRTQPCRPMSAATPRDVLSFWFEDAAESPEALRRRSAVWFHGDSAFDRECATRFAVALEDAARGGLGDWAGTPHGRLALVILLDQIPRNIHRGSPAAFMHDTRAAAHCIAGIESGQDRALNPIERIFLYMPLQHAEDLDLQRRSVERFESLASEAGDDWLDRFAENVRFARLHRDVIERFGRFPHRNRILGRESTEEERRYLADGAPTFGQ